jgi:amidase
MGERRRSARWIAAEIAAERLTCEAALRECLQRIAGREADVQAWQHLDAEAALATARALDRGPSRGVLHGVPIGVKDVIDTVDMPTTYGSPLYVGNRVAQDAACVAISRAKGAVIVGKTVTTEFAFVSPGKTRNPHNPAHTPGGSSSGSAAAVGAGMVPLAFGTQTAGSVIRPASFCGAVGYKPSFGLIERYGVKTLASSFDTVGVLASDVADAAFFTAAVADRPALADVECAANLRVGFYRTRQWDKAESATQQALVRAAQAFRDAGCSVRDIEVGGEPDYLDLHEAVMDWDVPHAFSFERLFHRDKLTQRTQEQLAVLESRMSLQRYEAARRGMQHARAALPELFGDCDVLLTPAAPGEAPAGLGSTGDALFNRGWTMLHVPCVTVPTGAGPGGLPVGAQLVGRIGDDARVLSAALTLQAALGLV